MKLDGTDGKKKKLPRVDRTFEKWIEDIRRRYWPIWRLNTRLWHLGAIRTPHLRPVRNLNAILESQWVGPEMLCGVLGKGQGEEKPLERARRRMHSQVA